MPRPDDDPGSASHLPAGVTTVTLAHAADVEGFRASCRALWAAQVPPERIAWRSADAAEADLFATDTDTTDATDAAPGALATRVAAARNATPTITPSPPADPDVPALRIPPRLLPEVMHAALHADADRHALLYRLLWRLQREPALRDDALDADVVRTKQMAQAVRRDMHKMTAFVRFRPVHDPAAERDDPLHVAWVEPEHHTLEATAPFFMRRYANMRFAILTPERSVEWNGRGLVFGPGGRREEAPPADAGEALWLTYYEHIFNPARLKVAMMKREMPVRYWKNLPEAERITPLVATAEERAMRMVEQAPAPPSPRRAVAPMTTGAHHRAPTPDLQALAERLERCRECPIGQLATQAVPGDGPRGARLMFVGEQPGDVEDLKGLPFVGPAGQLFDEALAELGIDRSVAWVSNAVKHFKYELRGKRRIHKTPSQQEAAACLHWLEEEIGLVDPDALVALGATAARSLLGRTVAVTRERGSWLRRADGRRVLVTLHPSALLRMEPAEQDRAWAAWLADLQQVQHVLAQPARAPG